jgi:cellulose synthase operon protein C
MRLRLGPTLCLALALASATGLAADPASGQIASQARYWEQKGRHDLARESWLKLLRIDPASSDALAGLAAAEIRSGRPEMAKQYLQGLRQLDPKHPQLSRLETLLATGAASAGAGNGSGELERARELARRQQYDQSIAEYQRLFQGKPPEGPVALEYWQTLAGAEGGWSEARTGLERLVKDNPGNADYRLALAQHLTYREDTRRQGLDQLMALADQDAGRQPVQPVWRQALLWMGGRPQDARYFQAYLKRYGDDTQVSSKLAAARSGGGGAGVAGSGAPRIDVRGRALKNAWALFNAGKVDEAEAAFASLQQKNPRDADVVAGLGIIRLRQDRFAESRELLERATRLSPGRSRQWSEALASARFWEQVQLAEGERKAGNLAASERRLRSAIGAAPGIAAKEPSVRLTLADTLLAQDRAEEAERIYRDVLQRDPDNADAARGLMSTLAQSGRVGDALALYRKLTPEQQKAIGPVGSLQALALRQQAAQALALGDESGAERLLKEALVSDPQSTWPRLDLARLYLRQDRRDEARSLIDGLPTSGPQHGEASYIRALIAAEEQNWYDGLMWLEQVPQDERSREMASVQQRLWVRYQTERAAVLARQGRRDEALTLLAQVEPFARTPELTGSLAFAYLETGDAGRALYLLRQEIARKPNADADLRLAYAGLLLKLQQHAEFDAVVDQLARGPRLTAQQEGVLTEMRIAQRLRQADSVRQTGDIARAYDLLEPALRANPSDARLVMALAGLYGQAGEHERAASLYRYALKLDAGNLDAYQGLVQAGLARGREDEVDRYLSEALRIAPDSSKLHVLAGRVAKARGEDGRALQLFRRALELGPDSGSGGGRGPLRLQMLDADLRPVGAAAGATAHLSRADRSIAPRASHRARAVKVSRLSPAMELAQAEMTLPPMPPPGYKPPKFESAAPKTSLKLDVPRTFNPPPVGPEGLKLRVDPVLRSRDYAYEQPPLPSSETDQILKEIADITEKRSSWAGVGIGLRNRDGLNGLDQLDDIEMPIEVSLAAMDAGRMNLRIVPVFLDAGTVSGAQLPLFGTLAFADTAGLSYDQNDDGIALGAAYEVGKLTVDVGTSPLGFAVTNLVGGIRWAPRFGNWIVEADISRRSVTDSLLSYAGTRDPVTGREWGGVTATGGRLDVTYDLGKVGLYANGGFHVYDGKNTEENQEVSLGGGAYVHVYQSPIQRVTVGVNVTSLFFDENLRRFTFGHGVYFSPQRYLSFALPAEWVGGHERYSWKLYGAIGVQNFREDGAALYPEDSALQAAIEQFAIDNPDPVIATGYPSQSSTGTGLSFGGQLEYLIAPHLVLGARAGFDNARDYDETRVLAYLRWSMSSRQAVAVPPRPLQTYAEYGKRAP